MDAIKKPAHYNQGPIECIDAMKIVLTPEEFRGYLKGNVFKYLWREKDKNGIEDLRKGREYYDRLIQLSDESEQRKEADIKSLMDYPFGEPEPVIKQSLTTEPPDGWRWLEVGEVIRKGDANYAIKPVPEHWVGTQCIVKHVALRRNKFEVGEKVVWIEDDTAWTVHERKHGKANYHYVLKSDNLGRLLTAANKLAPYIEEQS